MQSIRWGLISAISAVFVSVALGILFDVKAIHIFVRALIFAAVFFGFGFGLRFVLNSFLPELLYGSEEANIIESEQQGSRIDITLDSSGEYAVPELYVSSGDPQEMGNIEDLLTGSFRPGFNRDDESKSDTNAAESVDGINKSGYNDVGFFQDLEPETSGIGSAFDLGSFEPQDMSVFERTSTEKPAGFQPADDRANFTPSFGDDSGLGGLPDLDMMARAFSSTYGGSPMPAPSVAASSSAASSAPLPLTEELEPDRSQYKGNKPQPLQGDFHAKDIAKGLSTLLSKDK